MSPYIQEQHVSHDDSSMLVFDFLIASMISKGEGIYSIQAVLCNNYGIYATLEQIAYRIWAIEMSRVPQPWTQKEDDDLLQFFCQHGHNNFDILMFPGRRMCDLKERFAHIAHIAHNVVEYFSCDTTTLPTSDDKPLCNDADIVDALMSF